MVKVFPRLQVGQRDDIKLCVQSIIAIIVRGVVRGEDLRVEGVGLLDRGVDFEDGTYPV